MSKNWIEELNKYKKDWVNIAASFVGERYAEDIVQESYIRLLKYSDKNKMIFENGTVNKSYMWKTIRSVSLNLINERKYNIFSLEKEKHSLHDEFDSNLVSKEDALEKLLKMMNDEVDTWHWYDKKLYLLYKDSGMSFRTIASETGISWISIYNTIKNCKQRLKDKFQEDFEDYYNEDYELI